MDDIHVLSSLLPKDDQYITKCNEYMVYIDEHKTKVITAYNMYFKDRLYNILSNFMRDITTTECAVYEKMLADAVQNHDMSKYSDAEFNAYRIKYYPTNYEKELIKENQEKSELVEEMFKDAWRHHYTVNKHHPRFFIWNKITDDGFKLLQEPLQSPQDMDIISIMEMICDWSAMSKEYNYLGWWLNPEERRDEHEEMSYKTKMTVKLISQQILPEDCKDVTDDTIWFMDNKVVDKDNGE